MQASQRTVPYHDRVQARQKRRARLKVFLYGVCVFVAVGAAVWGVFYSSVLAITTVNIQGVSEPIQKAVLDIVNAQLTRIRFGFLYTRRNIMLFNADEAVRESIQKEPLVKTMTVSRAMPHTLNVAVTERTPLGIWCSSASPDAACSFFDESGIRWGTAVPSQGTLVMSVQDGRENGEPTKDLVESLTRVRTRLISFDIHITRFSLPTQGEGDVVVSTSDGWDGLFHLDGSLDEQLSTLEAYIMDRRRDGGITAKSIDARIAGRLYVK